MINHIAESIHLTSFLAFVYAAFVFLKVLVYGGPVQGYPSLMVVILFLGGTQLFSIGVMGEYLGRIFNETKGRPLNFVRDYYASISQDDGNGKW